MKKIVALLLTAALVCTFTGCGKSTSGGSAFDALPKDASPAQMVVADFTDRVNSGNYGELIDLATAMTEETKFYPFQTAFMFVEPGYLNGFTQEIDGFTEGFMFGPAIGSIPFVGYVFTLEDGVNAEEFVETLKSAGDLRWNICTEADEMLTGVVGDKVCFVMAPASFEE